MPPPDDDSVALAGEYVLGTLTASERAEAETRIGRETAFAAIVLAWEKYFAPLAAAAVPVQPPAHLRRRIIEAIGGSGQTADNVVSLRRQLNLWRGLTVGAAALAAALAAVILVRPPPAQLAGGKYVAVLQPQGPGPAFVATIDLASGTISALRIGAEPQAGKSYELWAVGGGRDKPQSLGLVDASLKIPAGKLGKIDPASLGDTVFAVSLEPQGGSPTGQPTGPVLYTGKLVATE
jgi:anti-sigma-K factor RskA